MTTKDTYCPSPWHGGFFTQSEQSVCCAYPPTPGNLISEYLGSDHVRSIKQHLVSGMVPAGCQRCFDVESQGGKSIRQIFRRTYAESGVVFEHDPKSPSLPQMIEVRLSNLCNFRCRICYPKWSSSITLEVDRNPQLKKYFTVNEVGSGRTSGSDTFLREITDMIPQLKWVNFTGGEPMIIPELTTIMAAMVDQGRSGDITIQITTNCSTVNPRITDWFPDFQRVLLTLSLDAVGSAAEYVRDGTDWSRVSSNVERYLCMQADVDNLDININTSLSAYSVLVIDDTMDYLLRLHAARPIRLDMLLVDDALSPYALQGPLRDRAVMSLRRALQMLSSHARITDDILTVTQQLQNLLAGMQDRAVTRDYDLFVQFTRDLDLSRGQDFSAIFGHPL